MAGSILITPRSVTERGHPALGRLSDAGFAVRFCTRGKQPAEAELLQLLPDCVGYLAGVEPISARVLEAAKQLKVIARNGTGVDNIDLAAAERLGIQVCRAEGANAQSVAELTIGLVFALARSLPFSDHGIKGGGWERRLGSELSGKTLGVVGCGRIGRIVAQLALGLGLRVVAYDVFPEPKFLPAGDFRFASLDEVLSQSDVISLHAPAASDGRPLLDAGAVAKLRPGVLVVNTARAGLVDAEAMLAALANGHVAGLALDVFDLEPPTDRRLASHDRVIATPHIGSYTRESVDRLVDVAVDHLLRELA
ncbi:MAG: phosphoglycerate dehydrogenase [Planctomycetota bacterium]|nr:phosphoglycerate dehydrogenase [Planctomycetota bacterium]